MLTQLLKHFINIKITKPNLLNYYYFRKMVRGRNYKTESKNHFKINL
jgi:hypothetical protein